VSVLVTLSGCRCKEGFDVTKNRRKKHETPVEQFLFRRTDTVGAADANEDRLLKDCFIDTGDLEVLKDLGEPRRFVVGRTGSGKSALLSRLAADSGDHAIVIRAESLAVAHVSNSTILRFLRELGVKLDLFFKLLWRHVFAIEILKRRFPLGEKNKRGIWDRLTDHFKDTKHRQALAYLQHWGGDKFWEETDNRVKDLTTKLETEVSDSCGAEVAAKIGSIKAGHASSSKFTEEERREVTSRAQKVVNELQLRELSLVIDLIDHVLNDSQDYYYIIIDGLDENWVEDDVRYLLIRALLETAKEFARVQRCKAVIALRLDLVDVVFDRCRDAGFQEEKYRSMFHEVRWSDVQLREMLDRRVGELIRRRYTKEGVQHHHVMPNRVDGEQSAFEFLVERTLQRPRDLIHFFNKCIEASDGKPTLSRGAIRDAEDKYSKERIRFLRDEWNIECPEFLEYTQLLKGKSVLTVDELDVGQLDDITSALFVK